jgi:hypothetical protein
VDKDVDQPCFDLRKNILLDVVEQNLKGKNLFDFLGADVVAIEGEIGKELKLSRKNRTFTWVPSNKILKLVALSDEHHLECVNYGHNLDDERVVLFEDQVIDLQLVLVEGLLLVSHKVDEDLEYLWTVLLSQVENFEILSEDKNKFVAGHLLQDEGLREGVNEELLCISVEGQKFSEGFYLLEEEQTVFVVTFAAVAQNFEAEVDDLAYLQRVDLDGLLLAEHFGRKAFDDLERAFDLEHIPGF